MSILTQTKKEKKLQLTLAEIVARKRANGAIMNRDRIRAMIKSRMAIATSVRNSQLNKVRVTRGLTDYANYLFKNDLKDLYNLLYDYTRNRTDITHLKHYQLGIIREKHYGNVRDILRTALKNEIVNHIKAGALRLSDIKILAPGKDLDLLFHKISYSDI
jgi:hypothetical protein